MKTIVRNHRKSALALVDMLIVVATLVVAVSFLFIYARRPRRSAAIRISCVNHLKQVGLAFRIYAGDNRDRFPMNISTNDETVVNEATPVYRYFKLTENELGTPRVVICPEDKKRKVANNFTNFGNGNVSYFIGLDANENLPQTMVAGDRNITNGFSPKRSILELTTNQPAGFTDEIHMKQGNVALGDGSVQQVSSARLRSEIIRNTGFATNRILLP